MVSLDSHWRRTHRAGVPVVALVVVGLAASLGGCRSAAAGKRATPTSSAPLVTTTTALTTTTTELVTKRPTAPPRLDDGSLGNRATRVVCRLLSRAQIRSQFGGPVSPATPTYPYCQWLVGSNVFLALAVEPGTSFNAATQYVTTLETIPGLGQRAIIANNRYLYFTSSGTSYWLLWQQVGDFTQLHTSQLVTLAHDVLAHDLSAVHAAPPVPGPPGPPIYFAGDSTAAGPEWAWDTYDASSPQLRTLAEYQVGSGLVSPGYFDWSRHLLAVVAARRPKLVIYMGSANDGQELVVNGAFQPVGSRLWREAYAARVSGIMAALTREGAKVLWIGEPAMQDPELSAYMQVMDEVCAQQAASHPGVTFFNPGSVLNGPHWSYVATRVIDGQPTDVRLDGVHLNMAGSIYLANDIAAFVSRILPLRAAPGSFSRPSPPRTGE